jgi:hypothetical protein
MSTESQYNINTIIDTTPTPIVSEYRPVRSNRIAKMQEVPEGAVVCPRGYSCIPNEVMIQIIQNNRREAPSITEPARVVNPTQQPVQSQQPIINNQQRTIIQQPVINSGVNSSAPNGINNPGIPSYPQSGIPTDPSIINQYPQQYQQQNPNQNQYNPVATPTNNGNGLTGVINFGLQYRF